MNEPDGNRAPKRSRLGTRVVLLAGFGGLLALMATAGADSVRALRHIQATNAEIHRDFLNREHTLDQIRASLYLSGSTVRDYILLDPGQSAAETQRADLKRIRLEMETALQAYAALVQPDEREAFQELNREIESYWAVLNPVFGWGPQEKRERGYWFLRSELFSRRTTVLQIARNIAAVNERTLRGGERRIAEVFAQFRRRLEIMTLAGVVLGLIVAAVSIIYILGLEADADQRYRESLRAQGELKKLSARLVEAQEQERQAISRELHDEVGQSLSALLMDIGNLGAAAPEAGEAFRKRLQSIKQLMESTVNSVRNISLLLRPSMLDDLGLVPALEWQAREVTKRTGLLVELVEENVSDALPEECKTCVYRIVQEALHNCSRHAEAQRARVVVRQEPQRLLLTIQDDGKGFDARRLRGMGLIGMSERVAHLGGSFEVESEPGRGTLLRIEVPLAGQTVEPHPVAS